MQYVIHVQPQQISKGNANTPWEYNLKDTPVIAGS